MRPARPYPRGGTPPRPAPRAGARRRRRDARLRVRAGEKVVITGRNGVGKSTLLRAARDASVPHNAAANILSEMSEAEEEKEEDLA